MRRRLLCVLVMASMTLILSNAQAELPLLTVETLPIERVVEAPNLTDTVYVDLTADDILYLNAQPHDSGIVQTELVAPDGSVLARYAPSYFPEVELGWVSIPTAGRYAIVTEMADSGRYQVSFRLRDAPVLTPSSEERERLGHYMDSAPFVIEGQAGQVIHVRAFSDELDPILTLIAPDGTILAQNDDNAGFLDAEVLNVTLPQTGNYRAVITRHDRETTSGFVHIQFWVVTDRWFMLGEERLVEVLPDTAWLPLHLYAHAGEVLNVEFEVLEGAAYLEVRDNDVYATTRQDGADSQHGFDGLSVRVTGEQLFQVSLLNQDAPAKVRLKVSLSDLSALNQFNLSFGLSPKSPSRDIKVMAYSGVSSSLALTVAQTAYVDCGSYQVIVLQGDEMLGTFTADFEGMACGEIPLYVGLARKDGVVTVRLTLLSDRFTYFAVSGQVGYGEG